MRIAGHNRLALELKTKVKTISILKMVFISDKILAVKQNQAAPEGANETNLFYLGGELLAKKIGQGFTFQPGRAVGCLYGLDHNLVQGE